MMGNTPKTREQMINETQAKLLVSARKSFSTLGYAATSMDDFTASVGLTRGALYHHFGSKKGLFAAVVREIDGEIDQALLHISDQEPDAWKGLFKRGVAYLEMALTPEIQQVLLQDAKAVLGCELMQIQMQCMDSVSALLQRGMDDGVIQEANPETLGVLINGSLMEAAFWVTQDAGNNRDVAKSRLKDALHCWEVLMMGIRK